MSEDFSPGHQRPLLFKTCTHFSSPLAEESDHLYVLTHTTEEEKGVFKDRMLPPGGGDVQI